jgi:hypothetical protein
MRVDSLSTPNNLPLLNQRKANPMGFPIKLIEDNSLKVTQDGFEVKARLLWYRSLPLSCVENVSLAINGEPIDQQAIYFGINNTLYQLDELENLVDQTWFVQDSARLCVKKTGMVSKGQACAIEAEIVLRAPYIMVGPDIFLTMPTTYSVTQIAG